MDAVTSRDRRAAIERAWGQLTAPVVIPSGLPIPIEGTDQYHDFHAHNEHYYLAGVREPGAVLTFDPREGWGLFAALPGEDERIWVGEGRSLEEFAHASGLQQVRPLAALGEWLERRRGEPLALLGSTDILHRPAGYGLPSLRSLELEVDGQLSGLLGQAVAEQRRAKQPGELDLMREAARASVQGHLLALRTARAGLSERALQVELEAEFFRNGCERTAYGSIVATGPDGAVLHFAPTARPLRDGDLVLIDAAGEHEGYAADITRSFPAGGRFEGIQRDLYTLVLETQTAAIAAARPGREWKDLHLEASARIAAGLADLGILRGSAAALVEQDAHALFFPHGLGHLLGLATHDAGGCLAGRSPSDRFGLKWLRADLPLQPGYVITVEPGIYFIRAILQDPERRERYRDAVNWERVDELLDFGGIRIEDDIVVTGGEPEVLSGALPKSVAAIEELRREAVSA